MLDVSFDSLQRVGELVQERVHDQATVTQLAPATTDKSPGLRQRRRGYRG